MYMCVYACVCLYVLFIRKAERDKDSTPVYWSILQMSP